MLTAGLRYMLKSNKSIWSVLKKKQKKTLIFFKSKNEVCQRAKN